MNRIVKVKKLIELYERIIQILKDDNEFFDEKELDKFIKLHDFTLKMYTFTKSFSGDKEIEEIPQFKGTLQELDNLTLGE